MLWKLNIQSTMKEDNINIGISNDNRQGVVSILNNTLADQFVIYTKTRNYHWNVVGKDFYQLHTLLKEQYEALDEAIDETAERVRQLGGHSVGTMTEYIKMARLQEIPGDYPNDMTMIANLVEDHESVIRTLREDATASEEKYNDIGTQDFLTELLQKHEKMV